MKIFTCKCCGIKAVYSALTDDSSSALRGSCRCGRLGALLADAGIPEIKKENKIILFLCRIITTNISNNSIVQQLP